MSPSNDHAAPAWRRRGLAGWHAFAAALVLATLCAGPVPAASDEGEVGERGGQRSTALEPKGVPAGAPYEVRGVIDWLDHRDRRIVVDGTEYRFSTPRVHRPPDAPSMEDRSYEVPRLRPGMTVGLSIGRGNPRPVLEVWILR